jgi:hypothetical protein
MDEGDEGRADSASHPAQGVLVAFLRNKLRRLFNRESLSFQTPVESASTVLFTEQFSLRAYDEATRSAGRGALKGGEVRVAPESFDRDVKRLVAAEAANPEGIAVAERLFRSAQHGAWQPEIHVHSHPTILTAEEGCRSCGRSGQVACNPCRGSGQVDCSACGGRARVLCPGCGGMGGASNTVHVNGISHTVRVTCSTCSGMGQIRCHCYTGKVTCHACFGGRLQTCGSCAGAGVFTLRAGAHLLMSWWGDGPFEDGKACSDVRSLIAAVGLPTFRAEHAVGCTTSMPSNRSKVHAYTARRWTYEARVGSKGYPIRHWGKQHALVDAGGIAEPFVERLLAETKDAVGFGLKWLIPGTTRRTRRLFNQVFGTPLLVDATSAKSLVGSSVHATAGAISKERFDEWHRDLTRIRSRLRGSRTIRLWCVVLAAGVVFAYSRSRVPWLETHQNVIWQLGFAAALALTAYLGHLGWTLLGGRGAGFGPYRRWHADDRAFVTPLHMVISVVLFFAASLGTTYYREGPSAFAAPPSASAVATPAPVTRTPATKKRLPAPAPHVRLPAVAADPT